MSIVTVFCQLKKKDKINLKDTIVVAIGSIVGGVIGQNIMDIIYKKRLIWGLLVIFKI